MDKKLKKVARTGYIAKGSVYAITGILTFLEAINLGGQKASKLTVLDFLEKQPFGNILLLVMAIGLLSFSYWRFSQAISNPENIDSGKKGTLKRVAFFISGATYLGLAVFAVLRVIGSQSSSGGTEKSHFLATNSGLILLGAVGFIFIIMGITKFVKAYKGDFTEKFDLKSIREEKRRKTIKNSGYLGITSRGVVFLIIGFFALQAALNANPSEIKTTAEVFSFLQDSSYGAWLMGLVAIGFIGYAVYMFMMAKYRKFND